MIASRIDSAAFVSIAWVAIVWLGGGGCTVRDTRLEDTRLEDTRLEDTRLEDTRLEGPPSESTAPGNDDLPVRNGDTREPPVSLEFSAGDDASLSEQLDARLADHDAAAVSRAAAKFLAANAADRALPLALLRRLDRLDPSAFAALRDGSVASRVVALAVAARRGDAASLRESVVLALEYHGEIELFDRALRSLFPSANNASLYAGDPRPLEFVDRLREGFESASFDAAIGWRVE